MQLTRPGACDSCAAAGDDRPKRLLYDVRSGVSLCYHCAGVEVEEPAPRHYREDANPYGYDVEQDEPEQDPCSDPAEVDPPY